MEHLIAINHTTGDVYNIQPIVQLMCNLDALSAPMSEDFDKIIRFINENTDYSKINAQDISDNMTILYEFRDAFLKVEKTHLQAMREKLAQAEVQLVKFKQVKDALHDLERISKNTAVRTLIEFTRAQITSVEKVIEALTMEVRLHEQD